MCVLWTNVPHLRQFLLFFSCGQNRCDEHIIQYIFRFPWGHLIRILFFGTAITAVTFSSCSGGMLTRISVFLQSTQLLFRFLWTQNVWGEHILHCCLIVSCGHLGGFHLFLTTTSIAATLSSWSSSVHISIADGGEILSWRDIVWIYNNVHILLEVW